MWLCKKKFKARIKGICKIKTLQGQVDSMDQILKQLKPDKDQAAEHQNLLAIKQQMTGVITKIKDSPAITEKEIDQSYDQLFQACDHGSKKLKSLLEQQKLKDEQERLRKIQVRTIRTLIFSSAEFFAFLHYRFLDLKGGNAVGSEAERGGRTLKKARRRAA